MDKRKAIGDDPAMERPKTYRATIEVYFDVWSNEKPRNIARRMANCFNCTRGTNLCCAGVLKKLEKWSIRKTIEQVWH